MANNKIIYVSHIDEHTNLSDWLPYTYNIKSIDNSKIESKLIISDDRKIISVPVSQLKWGLYTKREEGCHCVYDISLEKPDKNNLYYLSNRIKFHTLPTFFQRNLKCSNIVFCLTDTNNDFALVKYPVPIIKMLLFTCGYTQPTSLVSCLIKDIFPIIFEFYQEIYPLFES